MVSGRAAKSLNSLRILHSYIPKCQKLSRLEASDIILTYGQHWTCYECTSSMLPINACMENFPRINTNNTVKFKKKCESCNGFSYTPRNVVDITNKFFFIENFKIISMNENYTIIIN